MDFADGPVDRGWQLEVWSAMEDGVIENGRRLQDKIQGPMSELALLQKSGSASLEPSRVQMKGQTVGAPGALYASHS